MSLFGSQKKWAGIACLTLLLAWVPQGAWGEPVTTIRNNGNSANRVDLAILGDGYTASGLGKYATDVETFIQGLFAQEPLKEYQRYFNVHRVDVTSNQSGADHPERTPPVYVDTALDATYNCAGVQRLICVNVSKVNDVVSRSLSADQRDIILVIVNDTEYGGSGGAIAVASVHPAAVEVILHEEGHSFGLLADEYGGPPPPVCNSSVEPPEVNATRETQRAGIKWNHWIDGATPIPTPGTEPGVPGLYEGAKYCDTGLYRPTYNSKMRSLGMPFEQINSEQLVKRVYNWASPIDAIEPSGSTVTLLQGQRQTFRVQTPQPFTHSLDIAWKVDGQARETGGEFILDSSSLAIGPHTVEVVVTDSTSLVRSDSAQVLKESWRWDVTVTSSSGPNLTLGLNQSSFRSGQTLSLTATVTPGATPRTVDVYVAVSLPDGTLLFYPSFTTDLRPVLTNWTVTSFSGEIFRYTFTGGEPSGSYTWWAAFTEPGTLTLIGSIASASFTFSGGVAQFLPFVEGNPGVPGDGIVISAAGGNFPTEFELIAPFPLVGVTDGITIAAFFPPTGQQFQNFNITTENLNSPSQCVGIVGSGGGFPPGIVIVNGVSGVFQNLPQSFLQDIVSFYNQNRPGCNITLDDLFITGIALLTTVPLDPITVLDAAAIGLGQNVVP